MSSITTNTPVRFDKPAFLPRVSAFFAALKAGYAAERDFQRLEHLSTDALARKGLTRADAMRHVMERHFGA